jgi:hypothetical protein
MQLPNDNRVILAVGAGLAILAAVVLALLFMGGGDEAKKATTEEPDTTTGLTVDVADAPELQPSRELRCFVDGQFVGMATLANCAERNGLATDGLDVGLDASGNLAAAPTASFAPPPDLPATDLGEGNPEPVEATGGQNPQPAQASRAQQAGGAPCLRYVGSEWRQLSGGLSLNECVQALYAGTCVRPGEAQYGRHGNLTLRLVPRRVEQSNDNTRFRVLADQDRGCQFPSLR